MHVVHASCCGLDVHQAQLTACVRQVHLDGQVTQEVREFATTSAALLAMLDWLMEVHGPMVAMESTGVSWKPMYHGLVRTGAVLVGQAPEIQRRPGRKTDQADARGIAALRA
jgi:transposase